SEPDSPSKAVYRQQLPSPIRTLSVGRETTVETSADASGRLDCVKSGEVGGPHHHLHHRTQLGDGQLTATGSLASGHDGEQEELLNASSKKTTAIEISQMMLTMLSERSELAASQLLRKLPHPRRRRRLAEFNAKMERS
uniref:Uncharacterized protein n=1 Tax=Anopheles maculatus TaxID=74869 RepID=A0A182SXU6_9DIPT